MGKCAGVSGLVCVIAVWFGGCGSYPSNNAAMSICICRIAVTSLVVLVVDVDVSICSMVWILFLKFSILLLSACSISSTSTGFGDVGQAASSGGVFSICDPGSRRFLSVDTWGSFLALFADPKTKTDFCSNL